MANVDNPHGLRPLMRTITGGEPQVRTFQKDASAAVMYIYDVVQRDADGGISSGVSTPLLGVSLTYGKATTATDQLVVVSPGAVYEAQDNDDVDGLALVDMGANCNVEAGAGSATLLISGNELDESSADTTATLHVHLIELLNVPNNAYGAHARIEVCFNAAALGSQTAGIAA